MLTNLFLGQTAEEKNFIEDLFSVHLYTGNGSTQTITNGIDLAGKGGLVWVKARAGETYGGNVFVDTARGRASLISSSSVPTVSSTEGAYTSPANTDLVSFNSNGFTLGSDNWWNKNTNGQPYASWTFRKAPKFFDVLTYTGDGSNGRQISHSLGVAPGMIIVKRTDTSGTEWLVYHQSVTASKVLVLNTTDSAYTSSNYFNTPTSTYFSVQAHSGLNASGGSYVAYLFAHDTTADGVIQCGSMTTDATGVSSLVNLGWEPQYILLKRSDGVQNWLVFDTMRGMSLSSTADLYPNLSNAENLVTPQRITLTPTGFQIAGTLSASATYIYLAIRRGPMRVPTDATKVFNPVTYTGAGAGNRSISTTNRPDTVWWASRDGTGYSSRFTFDRLRGVTDTGGSGSGGSLALNTTDAEYPNSAYHIDQLNNTSVRLGSSSVYGFDAGGLPGILWNFTRAPGFFDVTCYSGTGVARTVSHNLGVAPELMIVKSRSQAATNWWVYSSSLGSGYYLILNTTDAATAIGSQLWNSTNPTSSVFSIGTSTTINNSGSTYVAYLFATCPGVSKVGSYTGNGSSLNIDCGFTNGARFVIIKAVSTTGHWRIWDSARGIVAGNDPFLMTSSTAAENNTTDDIDPLSSGFTVNLGGTGINESGWQYIYLAIA